MCSPALSSPDNWITLTAAALRLRPWTNRKALARLAAPPPGTDQTKARPRSDSPVKRAGLTPGSNLVVYLPWVEAMEKYWGTEPGADWYPPGFQPARGTDGRFTTAGASS